MATTSTIKSLNELIIKVINAIHKSQKWFDETIVSMHGNHVSMTPLKYCLKAVTLMIVYSEKECSTLKRIELFITDQQKIEVLFIFRKKIEKVFLLQLIKHQ